MYPSNSKSLQREEINVNKNSELGNVTSDCKDHNKWVEQTKYVKNYSINSGEYLWVEQKN